MAGIDITSDLYTIVQNSNAHCIVVRNVFSQRKFKIYPSRYKNQTGKNYEIKGYMCTDTEEYKHFESNERTIKYAVSKEWYVNWESTQ